MNKSDWITIISIGLILLGFFLLFQYYYNNREDSCQGNPFVYGSKMMEEKYSRKFVGSGYFLGDNLRSPIILFNSENYSIFYQ